MDDLRNVLISALATVLEGTQMNCDKMHARCSVRGSGLCV